MLKRYAPDLSMRGHKKGIGNQYFPTFLQCFLRFLRHILSAEVYQLFTTPSRLLTTLRKKSFENIVGKGENAGNQHFLLFPQCFLPCQNTKNIFFTNILFVNGNCFEFGQVQTIVVW